MTVDGSRRTGAERRWLLSKRAGNGCRRRSKLQQSRQAELEQLKGERDQLVDRLARLQAEFENARKRAERERTEFRDYATGNVVEQFLPVLDNFELALKSTGRRSNCAAAWS